MGNGGDGRQAAERPPGEGGVRLRVRDRLGFLIYITHIGLGLLHLGWALLVSGGCGCTRGWKSRSAPAPANCDWWLVFIAPISDSSLHRVKC